SSFAFLYEINIEGFEGEQTSFLCSHKLASSRKKYFCKDPCNKDEDILARVEPGGRTVKGRLSLKDFGDGVFSVTFNPLQLSDTHLYYCAVERLVSTMQTFLSINPKQKHIKHHTTRGFYAHISNFCFLFLTLT
uniref:Immunoglobulin V-set domain-containing protein n=1 Tax=Oryzias latipes TaxID=8090 RepID=A0A3P9LAR8_ORYLA